MRNYCNMTLVNKTDPDSRIWAYVPVCHWACLQLKGSGILWPLPSGPRLLGPVGSSGRERRLFLGELTNQAPSL